MLNHCYINKTVSIAPMMEWTDKHCRYFHRLITRYSVLYTEMVTTGALLNGDRERLLAFNNEEHPLSLQLGGSNPVEMAECAKIAEGFGYDEINMNVGCPSSRVQKGRFGACLMAEPELVAECVVAMKNAVSIPVTVKSRIGIDHMDTYQDLNNFVSTVAGAGCCVFIIHARKAWLKGLSPKENREIPPLRYDRVYRLKEDHPHLTLVINGGIQNLDLVEQHLAKMDGVMIGREAYHNPYLLSDVDGRIFKHSEAAKSRHEIIDQYLDYITQQLKAGVRLSHMTRHILGLFHGQPGARSWRRHLSENANKTNAGAEVVMQALSYVS